MSRDDRSGSKPRLVAAASAALAIAAFVAPSRLLALSPPCLFSTLTGHDCWGCGITHALLAALHGNFAEAWQHNRLVVLVLPLLGREWLHAVRNPRCQAPARPDFSPV